MAITCGLCAKKIDRYEDYILCKSKCAKNFHLVCANVSVEKFTGMRESGDIKTWSCEKCGEDITYSDKSAGTSITMDANNEPIHDMSAFIAMKVNEAIQMLTKALINPLKAEIANLAAQNKILSNEIKSFKNTIKEHCDKTNSISGKRDSAMSENESAKLRTVDIERNNVDKKSKSNELVQNKQRAQENIDAVAVTLKNTGTKPKVINKGNTTDKNMETKNATNNINTDDGNAWTTVTRNRKRSFIRGTAAEPENTAFLAAPRLCWYFLGDVDQACSTAAVKDYITKHICGTGVVKVEELKIRSDSVKAFKVGFESQHEENFKNSELWPQNVRIQRYSFLAEKMRARARKE